MEVSKSNRKAPLAILTGGNSGIGSAIGERLASNGYSLIIVGRNESRLDQTSKYLTQKFEKKFSYSTQYLTCKVDLRESSAPDKILSTLNKIPDQENVDLLVNNAGIIHRHSFMETTESMWLEEIETNFLSPVRLIKKVLPIMREGSAIINVTSTLGFRPIPNTLAYSATKAALNNLTQGLALELAPKIRVCGVCPGLTDTPIHSFHHEDEKSTTRKTAHESQPMGRMGKPEEIAAMVAFLASKDSCWTTGSLHTVDGGISLT
ncbi:MAG: SDR family oxidoreductase [Bdellovibrionales bacterium]|nr:SDR family oxidoreductase [Bdellovibrionales bacterium]